MLRFFLLQISWRVGQESVLTQGLGALLIVGIRRQRLGALCYLCCILFSELILPLSIQQNSPSSRTQLYLSTCAFSFYIIMWMLVEWSEDQQIYPTYKIIRKKYVLEKDCVQFGKYIRFRDKRSRKKRRAKIVMCSGMFLFL